MEKKSKEFVQHLYHEIEDEDEGLAYKEEAMPLVGAVVLYFNGLEKDLDANICETFTDRSDSTGLLVLHRMGYSTKVDLFKRLNENLFQSCGSTVEGHSALIDDLLECGKLRNLVVHADWESTDKTGFTYVSLKIKSGKMTQEYVQFSTDSLLKIIDLVLSTREKLEKFWESRNVLLNS